ncbi:MAG TPA: hypothetical protein PLQ11_05500 [Beijerinckiaceae bacterium]|nr:hypothetical protein [Beijerinckiaceae bacterium]
MKKALACVALSLLIGGSGVLVSATPADAIGIVYGKKDGKQKKPAKQQKAPQRR